MKLRKLDPPYLWRYLAERAFHRAHAEAPLIVANAVPNRFDGGFTAVQIRRRQLCLGRWMIALSNRSAARARAVMLLEKSANSGTAACCGSRP